MTRQQQLRDACKTAGLKGFGKHGNKKLEEMLREAGVPVPDPLPPQESASSEAAPPQEGSPAESAGTETTPDSTTNESEAETMATKKPPKGKKTKAPKTKAPKAKKAGKPRGPRDGSIKTWLQKRIDQYGKVEVAKAVAYAEEQKRSKVTVYRQASELGLTARKEKGYFVKG